MKSKTLLYVLLTLGAAALCVCGTGGGMSYRFFTAGVNPFREIKMATLGEAIEIREHPTGPGVMHRTLIIDSIDHGGQFHDAPAPGVPGMQMLWGRMPTTYYHSRGPVGMSYGKMSWFANPNNPLHASDARLPADFVATGCLSAISGPWAMLTPTWTEPPVGTVMMNNGTLAAYARPYQVFDFYESNPKIAQLSVVKDGETPKFTYLADAKKRGAHVRVFEGPERKTFDKESPKRFYHLLFVDTSRGHPGLPAKDLLTKEAMLSYMDSLVEDGVVCFHTSSRDYRLEEVVASVSNSAGLAHLNLHDGAGDRNIGHYTSAWVAVARKADSLRYISEAGNLRDQRNPPKMAHEKFMANQAPTNPALSWTDAGANSLTAARR